MSLTLSPSSFPVFWQTLDWQAKPHPSKTAIAFEGQTFSYAELAIATQRMAQALHERDIQAGDRIAFLGLNHPLQIALLFACARIGAIFLPLNYRLAATEWQAIVDDCKPRLLVSDKTWHDGAKEIQNPRLATALLTDLLSEKLFTKATASPDSPALLVYTSGTTGLPKGALHTQANLMANMQIAQTNQALTATDCVASMLPLFHVGGLCIQTLPALLAGGQVILHARFEPEAALSCVARERPSTTLQVPATMRAMIEHAQWESTDLSSLKIKGLWAGSSILPPALIEAFHARGVPVCNVYGSTETGPFTLALPPEKAHSHIGSSGWPASEAVEIKLLDEREGIGEIAVRAPNVATCYWPHIDLKDSEGWFHTGDLAKRSADGSYTIVGRSKDMIISGGENIYPAEIENLLLAHPAVLECAVIGLPNPLWGETVAAAIVLKPELNLPPEAVLHNLQNSLKSQLAKFKHPKDWRLVVNLPKTALGKVQRSGLIHFFTY